MADRPRYIGDLEELVQVVWGEREPLFSTAHDLLVHETFIRAGGGER